MARIAVDMQELSEKISIVSKVVPSKVIKPILGCVLFDLNEKGVYLLASDLETSVKARLNCEYEGLGKFAVDAKVLYEVVKTLPNDVGATLELTPSNLSIECGKSKFKLSAVDPTDFPEVSLGTIGASFEIEASLLYNMIERVIFCAAVDEFMRNLNGVYWELGNGFLRLVSSDGFRLALAEQRLPIRSEMGFLLSLKSMKELMNVTRGCGEKNLRFEYDGKRVGIMVADVETVVRVVEVEFPDYKRVLPKAFKTKVVVSTNDLIESLRRTMVIAKRGSESIRIEVVENVLILSSRSPDYGEVNEEIEVRKEGEDIIAAFNPKFLIEALRHIETEEVEMNFIDSTSPLQMNPLDVEGYLYVVMPIRIV
ncbi:DNA polymerase III subunit beta [Pseudothermotoga sp.]|nr:DNA polymerase III subunit beta [Pseudothermotoga sp.]MCX7812305.1 DNA polymerase III subunit beta [Pseudothermotoga sp.]MDW8139375.1 DNA polymerase III subunit beta [Pseudothermotoga sp.]